jgi:hypothetical protein
MLFWVVFLYFKERKNVFENAEMKRKRNEFKETVLNHKVSGELYIITPARVWKSYVLRHFNKIITKKVSVPELVTLLELQHGVVYQQEHTKVQYPILEYLNFLAKVSNKTIE